ncbi:MAG: hypothetical protein IKJ74_07860 [Clostridia bacterium]|nr:hypothetical protein [Clostridia bacterium]
MKKKHLAILCVAFALLLGLVGVILHWALRYAATGLAPLKELEGAYDYNGKLLLKEDGETAYLYQPVGRAVLEEKKRINLDLSPFGLEGKAFSYYRVDTQLDYGISCTNFYPADPAYEPFWPVCTAEKLIYLEEDGKKYRVLPAEKLSFPIFSDSVEGVDPYGTDVIAFSANASYALSLEGEEVTVYRTDPMDDSLRVVEVKTYSLKKYGNSVRFGAFVGNTQAYFIAEGDEGEVYVALDCATGETAASLLDPKGDYGKTVDRLYAQRLDVKEEKEGAIRLFWSHLLLGTEHKSPRLEGYGSGEILSVSPAGEYAVASMKEKDDVLVLSEKRSFSLLSALGEGENFEKAVFVYENVLAVSIARADGSRCLRLYKICF